MADESEADQKSYGVGERQNTKIEDTEIFQFYDAQNDLCLVITDIDGDKLRFEYRGDLWASVEMSEPVVNRLIRILEEWRK